jgi:hypothetical protein
MKYMARVERVLQPGIHKIAVSRGAGPPSMEDLPWPDRVEIEPEGGPDEPCRMYRYTQQDEPCGDTWHENLGAAFAQAAYEYGLSPREFVPLEEEAR